MLAVVGYFFPGAGYEQADSVFPREIVYTSESLDICILPEIKTFFGKLVE